MSQALTLASRDVMAEVYELLVTLDPARWREDADESARAQFARIADRLRELNQRFERTNGDAALEQLRERFTSLSHLFEEYREKMSDSRRRLSSEWSQLRTRLHPEYAVIASNLRHRSIAVPSIRPTNIKRSIMHILFAFTILVCIQFWMTEAVMIGASLAIATWAWSMEFFRRRSPWLNRVLMKFFMPVAHPHEVHGINSGTWYSSAMLLLATTSTPLASSVGVMILGFADPAAGAVGRRFGRRKLVGQRTVVGTLTFLLVAVVSAWIVIYFFGPAFSVVSLWILIVAAAIAGALGELFGGPLDDNLTIPVVSAWGFLLAMNVLGL